MKIPTTEFIERSCHEFMESDDSKDITIKQAFRKGCVWMVNSWVSQENFEYLRQKELKGVYVTKEQFIALWKDQARYPDLPHLLDALGLK